MSYIDWLPAVSFRDRAGNKTTTTTTTTSTTGICRHGLNAVSAG